MSMVNFINISYQEEENAEFLESKGTGVWIRKNDSPYEVLKNIIDNPVKLEEMKKNTEILAKKHSTEDICKTIL